MSTELVSEEINGFSIASLVLDILGILISVTWNQGDSLGIDLCSVVGWFAILPRRDRDGDRRACSDP